MKYIILGIKDYCKDTWHDLLISLVKKTGCCVMEFCESATMEEHDCNKCWIISSKSKEGSVLHYIRQRKIAKKHKGKDK